MRVPPYPGSDWRAWANELVNFLMQQNDSFAEKTPQTVQLEHMRGGEKALTDGMIMYDPDSEEVVVSKGGVWTKVSDGTTI